jgi:hypothetical protein
MKTEKDSEVRFQHHEEHCWLWVIPFKGRTIHSCNCNANTRYQREFNDRRKPKLKQQKEKK